MNISTRTRYGVKLLVYLASKDRDENIQLNEIALGEGISIKYLEKIVQYLKRGGLVRVTRGAKGGYRLSRAPESINLKEVLTILEGSGSVFEWGDDNDPFWSDLSGVISNYLEGRTLDSLIKGYDYPMYYI